MYYYYLRQHEKYTMLSVPRAFLKVLWASGLAVGRLAPCMDPMAVQVPLHRLHQSHSSPLEKWICGLKLVTVVYKHNKECACESGNGARAFSVNFTGLACWHARHNKRSHLFALNRATQHSGKARYYGCFGEQNWAGNVLTGLLHCGIDAAGLFISKKRSYRV